MLDCQLDTFAPSSIAELLKVVRTLESKSDPLPAALLKEHFDMLLPTLCMIVKLTLESGKLPASLKMPSYHHYSRNLETLVIIGQSQTLKFLNTSKKL